MSIHYSSLITSYSYLWFDSLMARQNESIFLHSFCKLYSFLRKAMRIFCHKITAYFFYSKVMTSYQEVDLLIFSWETSFKVTHAKMLHVVRTWRCEKFLRNSIKSLSPCWSVLEFWNSQFEKSSLTNLIFFELDFYCLCSLQKSSSN